MEGEELVLPIPRLVLAQHQFTLSTPELSHLHDEARKALLEGIEADRTSRHDATQTCSPW